MTIQAEVMAIIDDLRKEFGVSLLFITHDLDLAAAVCDRTAVMYAGQLVELQRAASLHDDPYHPYTAALAGARGPASTNTAARLTAIPGRPVSAYEAPAGCAFAPRCPYAEDRCREARPRSRTSPSGKVRCVRAEELRGSMKAVGMAEAVLEVAGPHQEVRRRSTAVDDVSFAIPEPGQSLAVVGESGSGKTTVARMIVGLERATAGTIRACGRDRSHARAQGAATGATAAARCRSSSRIRTPASIRASRAPRPSTRC